MTKASITPSNVHALIVGIEKYDAGSPDYDLNGPASDAVNFLDWLLDRGVEPEKIHLFLSPLENNKRRLDAHIKAKGLSLKPAKSQEIRKAIDYELLQEGKKGDLLYIFWSGHGFITKTDSTIRRLFLEDTDNVSKRNLNLNSLLEALKTSTYGSGFSRQILLIDACANSYYRDLNKTLQGVASGEDFAANGDINKAEQFVLFASAEYEVTTNDSDAGIGTFSKVVLEELGEQPLLPEMIEIANRVQEKFESDQSLNPIYLWSRQFNGNEIENPYSDLPISPPRNIIINGDVIFKLFSDAPSPLSKYIKINQFKSLIAERTRNFVGREFIFKQINELIGDENFLSGYIVIRGEPGIGKTSIISQFIKQNGAVHHFNIASQNIRSTRLFIENICAQLILRYNLHYDSLPPNVAEDSGFLVQILSEASSSESCPILVLVDALDEADDKGLDLTANNRLLLPSSLPDNVFFIVTCREKDDFRLKVDNRRDIYLKDNDPLNEKDINEYIKGYLERSSNSSALLKSWGIKEEDFINIMRKKSEGNFMYLVYILEDIKQGKLTLENVDDISKLPTGLKDYYKWHWRNMRSKDTDRFEKYYEPVVCTLATAREPVTIEQLAEWTKVPTLRIKDVIKDWIEFLDVLQSDKNSLYRVYHSSFRDFLEEEVGLQKNDIKIANIALEKIIPIL